jgi:hypothetical protein
MNAIRIVVSVVLLCSAAAAPAFAQRALPAAEWRHATTLDGFAGVAVDQDRTGPLFGGAVGWEMTPRLAIEGSGSWTEFGTRNTAFGAALKLRTRLTGQRKVDPYVEGGVGLYHANFAPHQPIPDFYRDRMSEQAGSEHLGPSFTDPTLVAGGGVTLFLKRQIAVRPAVEAAFVLGGGGTHVVTTFALHGVYYFEQRPVTPARGK